MLLGRRRDVSDQFEVAVVKPSYLRTVDGLLAKTDQRVVVNYFIWRVVDRVIGVDILKTRTEIVQCGILPADASPLELASPLRNQRVPLVY